MVPGTHDRFGDACYRRSGPAVSTHGDMRDLVTLFIRRNENDGSIDRALLARQFESCLVAGRPGDAVALLELIAALARPTDALDAARHPVPGISGAAV